MPLTISIEKGSEPKATLVTPATLKKLMKDHGDPNASDPKPAAITMPKVRVDQTKMQWEQRRSTKGVQFRFKSGTLKLTILQQIAMNATLNACEQKEWMKHEKLHVKDNFGLGPQLERDFRASNLFKKLFDRREWQAKSKWRETQKNIQKEVGKVFKKLTGDKVKTRDTKANYAKVHAEIDKTCKKP